MNLLQLFSSVKDNRRRQGRMYELHYVLLFTIMAIISNAISYRNVAEYIKENFEYLKEYFKLNWKKPPAYTGLRKIILSVDKEELERVLREFSQAVLHSKPDKHISIDGKTLRGSFDNINDQNMCQLISLFGVESGIIIGQDEEFRDKTNEIPVVQELLKVLKIPRGTIITADALHTQKKHSREHKRKS
jgi:type I restriction-modification system DNA methylase subunit